jgi:hypothetical protein
MDEFREREHLAQADWHIAEAKAHIARQKDTHCRAKARRTRNQGGHVDAQLPSNTLFVPSSSIAR